MIEKRPPERLVVLCATLAEATRVGEAEWRPEGEDTYVWERQEGSVAIGSRDRDAQPPYEVAVFNDARQQVDTLSSTLLDDDQPAPWNDVLAHLYLVARRSALRADEIIDALIQAIPVRTASGDPGLTTMREG